VEIAEAMLVEIECITIAQNEATTEVVALVENRDQNS
jgi:hypothetical protein